MSSSLRHDELRDGAVRSGGFPAVSADGISSSCPVGVHGNGIALVIIDGVYGGCSLSRRRDVRASAGVRACSDAGNERLRGVGGVRMGNRVPADPCLRHLHGPAKRAPGCTRGLWSSTGTSPAASLLSRKATQCLSFASPTPAISSRATFRLLGSFAIGPASV